MAAAMTYDSLVTDIQIYSERDDSTFVDQIPRFIMLAENRIASEVHSLGYRRVVTGSFTIGQPLMNKPARWRETIELSYTDGNNEKQYLYQRGYGYCRAYWPNQTLQDEPEFYADVDYEHWLIVPTPVSARDFELHYHERPEPLDSTNQTNWTTRYAPQILLYASLLEAQPFLKRADRIQEFLGLYQAAVGSLASEEKMRLEGDQTNIRSNG